MKRILYFTLIAIMSAGTLYAQKSVVKEAKRALDSNNLNEAKKPHSTSYHSSGNSQRSRNLENLWRYRQQSVRQRTYKPDAW